MSDNERTLELIRKGATMLVKGLSFTVDSQEIHEDGRCPMLDLKVWKEKGRMVSQRSGTHSMRRR